MASHSGIYSCLENPMDGGAQQATVHGVGKSQTRPSDFTFTFHFHALGRKWQPTPVFLPGESQGQRSLVGCRLWGRTELDTTEATQRQQQHKQLSYDLCLSLGLSVSLKIAVFCSVLWIIFIAYMYHIFFIHSSIAGHFNLKLLIFFKNYLPLPNVEDILLCLPIKSLWVQLL